MLLEPCVAGPLLAVVGDSPAARALSQLAPAVGWRVSREVAGAPDAVVIAAMGRGDEDTLQAALASGAGYVGLVASTRRAASVFDVLRDRGANTDSREFQDVVPAISLRENERGAHRQWLGPAMASAHRCLCHL